MVGVRVSWLQSMERFHWPWTSSWYVCIPACLTLVMRLRLDPVWSHNDITRTQYHDTLKWRSLACIYLGCIDGTISLALDEQAVRLYCCVLDLVVLLGLGVQWGHTLALVCWRHILQWRWLACTYVGWIDATISSALDGQRVRLYCCDLLSQV